MGPVSFEPIDLGADRAAALAAADVLRSDGMQIELVEPGGPGGTFRAMVRSTDVVRAVHLLDVRPTG